ncbi:MAG: hypothetical protein A2V21_311775 [Deltaproteobacteria bacterium GWC2_55_46]|nr:MAG: hypothetical protein A2V21_311775 [Deltaproteobacteria bacterium GWC2_55_46]
MLFPAVAHPVPKISFLFSREEAKADLFDYIEIFYNRTRRHSHLGHVSPYDVEMASSGKE